jgi:hypothetical protein
MSENKRSHRHHDRSESNGDHEHRPPYWRRAHRDWKFWVALTLMFAAMVFYVMSDDLALRLHRQSRQSISDPVTK